MNLRNVLHDLMVMGTGVAAGVARGAGGARDALDARHADVPGRGVAPPP